MAGQDNQGGIIEIRILHEIDAESQNYDFGKFGKECRIAELLIRPIQKIRAKSQFGEFGKLIPNS